MKNGIQDVWRVIYISHSSQAADAVEHVLQNEGFLTQRLPLDGTADDSCEIRVLKSEAMEARNLLAEKGL